MRSMGMTNVKLTVKNLRNPTKAYEGTFLVDSGATYTVVPKEQLAKIGIKPNREEQFSLADGTVVKRKVGDAYFEYQGSQAAAPILFGERGDEPLLGVFTLKALGLTLDPLKRQLHKASLRM